MIICSIMEISSGWLTVIYITGFIFLVAGAVLMVFGIKKGADNKVYRRENIALPFSGFANVNGDAPQNKPTNITLSCPTGTKVNVLGAHLSIYDPYQTCIPSTQQQNLVHYLDATPANPAYPSAFVQKACSPNSGSSYPCDESSTPIYSNYFGDHPNSSQVNQGAITDPTDFDKITDNGTKGTYYYCINGGTVWLNIDNNAWGLAGNVWEHAKKKYNNTLSKYSSMLCSTSDKKQTKDEQERRIFGISSKCWTNSNFDNNTTPPGSTYKVQDITYDVFKLCNDGKPQCQFLANAFGVPNVYPSSSSSPFSNLPKVPSGSKEGDTIQDYQIVGSYSCVAV